MSGRKLAAVIGGSGFIGRHTVAALARAGWRVRVVCRRPDLAYFLQPLGDPGQIAFIQANVRHAGSLAPALEGADAVFNLAGILVERGPQTFEAVHVRGAEAVARAAAEAGAARLVHVSAIGADAQSPSAYGRTKARGEQAVHRIFPEAVILRPSIVIGPEDEFFNRFAQMARLSPVLPLIGGGKTRFQPVVVTDVAAAALAAVSGRARPGAICELGGPEVWTFRELMEFMLGVIRRRRLLLPVPFAAAKLLALAAQFAPGKPLTPDQVRMLQTDNVVSEQARAEGRTLDGLGIEAEGIEALAEDCLARYRPAGQFTLVREAIAGLTRRG